MDQIENKKEVQLNILQDDQTQNKSSFSFKLSQMNDLVDQKQTTQNNSLNQDKKENLIDLNNCKVNKLIISKSGIMQNLPRLKEELEKFRFIQSIEITGFQSRFCDTYPQAFSLFSNIKELTIDNKFYKIRDYGMYYLGKGVSSCKYLQRLTLIAPLDGISSKGLIELGISLSMLKYLQGLTLNLYKNSIGCKGLEKFGSLIRNCQNLQKIILFFSQNEIRISGALGFLKNLSFLVNLRYLVLDFYQTLFSHEDSKQIVKILANYNKLSYLLIDVDNYSTYLGYKGYQQRKLEQRFQRKCIRLVIVGVDIDHNKVLMKSERNIISTII